MVNELEKGGSTMAFHIAKQRAREIRDILGVPCIQDENGILKTEISERLEVWRGYCKRLMNVENDWDGKWIMCLLRVHGRRCQRKKCGRH